MTIWKFSVGYVLTAICLNAKHSTMRCQWIVAQRRLEQAPSASALVLLSCQQKHKAVDVLPYHQRHTFTQPSAAARCPETLRRPRSRRPQARCFASPYSLQRTLWQLTGPTAGSKTVFSPEMLTWPAETKSRISMPASTKAKDVQLIVPRCKVEERSRLRIECHNRDENIDGGFRVNFSKRSAGKTPLPQTQTPYCSIGVRPGRPCGVWLVRRCRCFLLVG